LSRMTTRQVGDILFETKDYDVVNRGEKRNKEESKVGYNLSAGRCCRLGLVADCRPPR